MRKRPAIRISFDIGFTLVMYLNNFFVSIKKLPSPYINRFLSPDTIVPGAANPQAFNRYSYVLGNPLKYIDPTGHGQCQTQEDCDDMGTTPMGNGGGGNGNTGNNGSNGGGGSHHDDDDVDPNPNGFVYTPPEPDPVVTLLRNVSTTLDVLAWSIDLYNAGVVTYGGIFGAGIAAPFALGGPEVPVATGLAGMAIAELAVQPSLQFANRLAVVSTIFTIVADVRAGDTNLEQGVIAPTTLNSVTTTVAGLAIPEAYSSLVIQSVTVSNDLGWISFPFSNENK